MENNEEESGSTVAAEDIGAKLRARYLPIGSVLEGRPILGSDERLAVEPGGNGLLADRRALHEGGDSLRERALAAGDLDGGLQGGDVPQLGVLRFLHEHPRYTTAVVRVNNCRRVPMNEHACTVVSVVPRLRKKLMERADTALRQAERSSDGKTLGERMRLCMDAKSREIGRPYRQKDLLADVREILGKSVDSDKAFSQQAISLILLNKRAESFATPVFAKVFKVEALWLAYGIGPATYIESMLTKK